MSLTPRERQYLKGLGHHLEPLIQVGKDGLGETQLAALEQALFDHELIKVKIGKNAPLDLDEVKAILIDETGAEIVQTIGKVLLIYVPHPEKPQIDLALARQESRKR